MKLAALAVLLAGNTWTQVQVYEILPRSSTVSLCMIGAVTGVDITEQQVILTLDRGFIANSSGGLDPYEDAPITLRVSANDANEIEVHRIGPTRVAIVTRAGTYTQRTMTVRTSCHRTSSWGESTSRTPGKPELINPHDARRPPHWAASSLLHFYFFGTLTVPSK